MQIYQILQFHTQRLSLICFVGYPEQNIQLGWLNIQYYKKEICGESGEPLAHLVM